MEKNILTKKIQTKTLEMLKEIKKIFDQNDIPFYLAYGTALGCVRHKGFIPWDDDIDIYVKSSDYSKIQKVFLTENTGNLILHDYTTQKNYPYYFPKIVAKDTYLKEKDLEHIDYSCGVYIDIFLLSDSTENNVVNFFREKQRYFYYGLLHAYYSNFDSKIKKMITTVTKTLFNPNKIQKKLYENYMKTYDKSSYLIDTGRFGKASYLPKEMFESDLRMRFEDDDFPIPKLYDEYLRGCYGDYMKLPPKEMQVSNHNFIEIILDKE